MSIRCTLLAVLVPLTAGGCYQKPDSPLDTDGGTAGTAGSTGTTTESSVSGSDTSTTSTTASTTETGCTDECETPGASCMGDTLQVCEEGDDSCLDLTTMECNMGCTEGACIGGSCGDGMLQAPELCDDGNTDGGDGCSSSCEVEAGWTCDDEQPTQCTAPDLAVRIVSAVWANNNLDVTYTVENIGGADSGNYRIDLWDARFFDDPPLSTNAGVVTFADRPSLAPGELDMFTDTIPNAPQGDHVAYVIVDTADDLVELDDNNNLALGHAWTTGFNILFTTFLPTETAAPIPDDGTPLVRSLDIATVSTAPVIRASVNITHADVGELELELVAPNGATVPLFAGDASGQNFGGTTFAIDLVGGGTIADGAPPYIDQYPAAGSWSEAPTISGSWQLRVVDSAAGNDGRLNDWSVTLYEIDP